MSFILTQIIDYIKLKDILFEKSFDIATKMRLLALQHSDFFLGSLSPVLSRTPILLGNKVSKYLSELLK